MADYSHLISNIKEIEQLGDWIAGSRMFGCDNKDQGRVIAADCFLTGIPLLEYARRNKIVANKQFQQYDAMLTGFHECGGESKLICRTPEKASIELRYQGKTETFTLTWEDAQKEPFVYHPKYKEAEIVEMLAAGKQPLLKAKYATPRSRQTMLWARVVSDGIRATCPEVNYGTYTAEEISDIVDSETAVDHSESVATEPPARPATEAIASRKKKAVVPAREDTAVAEPVSEPVEVATVADAVAEPVESVTSVSLDEPITSAQYDRIIDLLAQIKASGVEDIKERIVEKLQKSGLKTLKDLTVSEGDLVISVLAEKNLEAWADLQLRGRTDNGLPF